MSWLLQTDGFVPRSHCGTNWSFALRFFNQTSNLVIFISYIWIATLLLHLWRRKNKDIPHAYLIFYFCLFIFFCGVTHLNDYFVFWWPAYRFMTLMHVFTAFFSILTAFILTFVLRYLLSLPSFELLYKTNEKAQHDVAILITSEKEYKTRCKALIVQVENLQTELNRSVWVKGRMQEIQKLQFVVERLRSD